MIMKYYIVALFDKDSYTNLSPVQRKYSKKFRGNRNSPLPYLTLNVVETSTIDKIVPIVEKVLQPYKKFKIEYDNNNASIYDPLKSIAVNVKDRGYIKKIYTKLEDMFELNGIPSILPSKENLNLSLANLSQPKDRKNTIDSVAEEEIISTLKVDRIEIWKLNPGKKETCMKTFELKSF